MEYELNETKQNMTSDDSMFVLECVPNYIRTNLLWDEIEYILYE